MVKSQPASARDERHVSREDPLEEGIATHSSILAWEIPWREGTWWATVHGVVQESYTA